MCHCIHIINFQIIDNMHLSSEKISEVILRCEQQGAHLPGPAPSFHNTVSFSAKSAPGRKEFLSSSFYVNRVSEVK